MFQPYQAHFCRVAFNGLPVLVSATSVCGCLLSISNVLNSVLLQLQTYSFWDSALTLFLLCSSWLYIIYSVCVCKYTWFIICPVLYLHSLFYGIYNRKSYLICFFFLIIFSCKKCQLGERIASFINYVRESSVIAFVQIYIKILSNLKNK